MMYETLYERCSGPFLPDINRGHWSNPRDFIYAGLSLGFRLDILGSSWNPDSGVIGVLPKYVICMVYYIIPMLVIQTFLGQFSNSGFIAAFRLSPLFKGIGYVALVLNICVLIYFSLFALIPLVYLFGSLYPTLPWDCDQQLNLTEHFKDRSCSFFNTTDCNTFSTRDCFAFHKKLPTVTYFESLFDDSNIFGMSWQMIIAAVSVWAIIGFIVYEFSTIEKIGKVIRYSLRAVIFLLVIIILRFSFLPDALSIYCKMFTLNWNDFVNDMKTIPAHGISALDPGWGLFITLASFNKFKTNIWTSSWIIGIGQIFILFGMDILENFTTEYLKDITLDNYREERAKYRTIYLSSGSIIADMPWPNLWSLIFYLMLFLAAIILMIIQLYSILYSLCDEFITLREHKIQITMILLSVMAVCSLYLTSILGINNFGYLQLEIYIIQSLFDFLLIIIILWIYGHNRFQRDVEFIIDGCFNNFKVYFLKFVTPVVTLISLALALIYYYLTVIFTEESTNTILETFFRPLPWLLLIIYALYCLFKVKGSFTKRLQKCYKPCDWYPVDVEDQQKYRDITDNAIMIHRLSTHNRSSNREENF